MGELARDLEQLGLVAALELEFDLAQRPRVAAAGDLALVQGQCDVAVSAAERIGRPPHPRLEHRLELPAKLAVEQRRQRGVLRQTQVRRSSSISLSHSSRANGPEFPADLMV